MRATSQPFAFGAGSLATVAALAATVRFDRPSVVALVVPLFLLVTARRRFAPALFGAAAGAAAFWPVCRASGGPGAALAAALAGLALWIVLLARDALRRRARATERSAGADARGLDAGPALAATAALAAALWQWRAVLESARRLMGDDACLVGAASAPAFAAAALGGAAFAFLSRRHPDAVGRLALGSSLLAVLLFATDPPSPHRLEQTARVIQQPSVSRTTFLAGAAFFSLVASGTPLLVAAAPAALLTERLRLAAVVVASLVPVGAVTPRSAPERLDPALSDLGAGPGRVPPAWPLGRPAGGTAAHLPEVGATSALFGPESARGYRIQLGVHTDEDLLRLLALAASRIRRASLWSDGLALFVLPETEAAGAEQAGLARLLEADDVALAARRARGDPRLALLASGRVRLARRRPAEAARQLLFLLAHQGTPTVPLTGPIDVRRLEARARLEAAAALLDDRIDEALRLAALVGGSFAKRAEEAWPRTRRRLLLRLLRMRAADPYDADVRRRLGRFHLGRGRLEPALEEATRAVELRPNDPAAVVNLERILARMARERRVKRTASGPLEPSALWGAVEQHFGRSARRRWQRAARHAAGALVLAPFEPERAAHHARRALELAPWSPEALAAYARVAPERDPRALEAARRFTRRHPLSPEGWALRAQREDDPRRRMRSLARFLRLRPP